MLAAVAARPLGRSAEQGCATLVEGVEEPGMLYVYSVPGSGRLLARQGDANAEAMLASRVASARGAQRSLLGVAYAGIAYVEWAWLSGRPAQAA